LVFKRCIFENISLILTIKIKSRLWVETEGKILLGEGRLKLLQAIDDHGSINMASKSLGMSYKKAWRLVQQLNEIGKDQIVVQKTGGTGGGGSVITPYGKKIMSVFEQMKFNVWEFMEQQEQLMNDLVQ